MEFTLQIQADVGNLTSLRQFVEKSATALGADESAIYGLVLSIDESATNTIVHGYQGKPGSIEITMWSEKGSIFARLRDQAAPFDPTTVPPPDLSTPLDERPLGGLGVFLTRQFMDKVVYRQTPGGGNELTLVKKAQAGRSKGVSQ